MSIKKLQSKFSNTLFELSVPLPCSLASSRSPCKRITSNSVCCLQMQVLSVWGLGKLMVNCFDPAFSANWTCQLTSPAVFYTYPWWILLHLLLGNYSICFIHIHLSHAEIPAVGTLSKSLLGTGPSTRHITEPARRKIYRSSWR